MVWYAFLYCSGRRISCSIFSPQLFLLDVHVDECSSNSHSCDVNGVFVAMFKDLAIVYMHVELSILEMVELTKLCFCGC